MFERSGLRSVRHGRAEETQYGWLQCDHGDTVTNSTDRYVSLEPRNKEIFYQALESEYAGRKVISVFSPIFLLFTSLSFQVITNLGIPVWGEQSQTDFSYSMTLFEKKCLPKPKLLLFHSIPPLAAILLTLLVMALMASKVAQIRLLLCEHFFSSVTEARVEYLHAKILRKRSRKRMCGLTSLCFQVCIHAFVNVYVIDCFFISIFFFCFSDISGFPCCSEPKRIHRVLSEEQSSTEIDVDTVL